MEEYSPIKVIHALNSLAAESYAIGRKNGFHDDNDVTDAHILNSYVRLALITTEVAEATEELRHPVQDIDWDKFTDELADILIRTVDLAAVYDLDIGLHTAEKMEFNRGRPYKHGGKAF